VDAREQRLVRNELLFRELNETIETVAHALHSVAAADPRGRAGRARLFLVAPGHDLLEIEDVVREAYGFQVVRKHGAAAAIAERHDPRG
jgi:hypothetical protein